jgi:hypothetical protein
MVNASGSDLVRCVCGALFSESEGDGCNDAKCRAEREVEARDRDLQMQQDAQDAMREDAFDDPDGNGG